MTDNTEKVDAVEKVPSIENQFGTEEVYNGKNELVGYAPTEEELATLRTVSDRLPLAAWSVAIVELGERFTYYGITGPFQNYMQNKRGGLRPGAIGLGQQGSSALSYFFQFWCYVTPIFGAVISDNYWGKYNTICVFSGVYVVGILVLFLTSLPVAIEHNAALGGLIAAMIIIGLGTGGIKSNVSPLIAEQYTITKPYIRTQKNGERVIVDPSTTIQSVFMMFYMCINVGSLSAIATTEMELHIDFWAAYLLPFCFFFIAIASLVLGRKYYVRRPAMGSVIPNAFRVILIGIKNGFKLDSAKPSVRRETGASEVAWSDLFVDEVYRALLACKVFIVYPVYWVVYGQMINNFVSQAGTMDTHGIPNDIMQNIDPIAVIVFIPIIERFVYPYLRKIGIRFKPITRIFFGFMFAALAMAYAAIVQHIIYTSGPCYDQPLACPASEDGTIPNQVHVAIQTPAYVFIALSEIFASVTGLEYAYTKAPSNMKAFIMSVFLFTNAIGSAIGIALSSTSVDPKLMWMYIGLAISTVIAGIIFWFLFKKYNQVEEELNAIDADYNAEALKATIAKADEEALKDH
jgi:POT family proton-dependent oligopeptide transporter